jgi:DNA invertase Pin-like site-specific DNA recombinase
MVGKAQGVARIEIGQSLNMLLSFAQFEREITGERTRDKPRRRRWASGWAGRSHWDTAWRIVRSMSWRTKPSSSAISFDAVAQA